MGQLEDAIVSYRQALRLQPDYADASSNLAVALKDQGRIDEAIAACQQAIRLRPDLAGAHSNLGSALNCKGRFDEAIAACRQAISAQARSCPSLLQHGLRLAMQVAT